MSEPEDSDLRLSVWEDHNGEWKYGIDDGLYHLNIGNTVPYRRRETCESGARFVIKRLHGEGALESFRTEEVHPWYFRSYWRRVSEVTE